MFTVSQLANKHGLSRSTLLYYDRVGLLHPSGRSAAGYRIYSQDDERKLALICEYRQAGLSLTAVRQALEGPSSLLAGIMEQRLDELNQEILLLRNQQRLLLGLLKNRHAMKRIGVMNKSTWVSLLKSAGFSQTDMDRWHRDFERTAPDKHQEFLEFLCIPAPEIKTIRAAALLD